MKKKAIVISDLHLRESIRVSGVTLEGDSRYAIKQLSEYVEYLEPDYCIIAGDIFHQTKVNDSELHLFKLLMEGLTKKIKPENILVIQGNHDRGQYNIPELFGCTNLDNNEIHIGKFKFVGKKFVSVEEYKKYFKNKEGTAVGYVIHAPARPFSSFALAVLEGKDFPEGSLIICGDTHLHSLVHKSIGGKHHCTMMSPGNICPGNKEELCRDNCSGAYFMEIDEETGQVDFDELRLKVRQCLTLEGTENSIEDIKQEITQFGLSCKAAGCSLTPVVIFDKAEIAELIPDTLLAIKTIRKNKEVENKEEDGVENTAGVSVLARIENIINKNLGDDIQKEDVVKTLRNLMSTDNLDSSISDLIAEIEIKKEIKED